MSRTIYLGSIVTFSMCALLACGEQNVGSELASVSRSSTSTAAPAATATPTTRSYTEELADMTLSELDSMQLPTVNWSDDRTIVKALHNKFSNDYCPNFDIDKNGRVESIETAELDQHGGKVIKGDQGIIRKALVSLNANAGWPQDLQTLNAPGAQISSQFKSRYNLTEGWYHVSYLQCLDRAGSFDLNNDGVKFDYGDIAGIYGALGNVGPVVPVKSRAQLLVREKLNNNLRVCYVYFKFNNETKPRVMQQSCAIGPNATFRRLPDLTSAKTRVDNMTTSCTYTSGTTYSVTLSTTGKDSSVTQCGDGLGGSN